MYIPLENSLKSFVSRSDAPEGEYFFQLVKKINLDSENYKPSTKNSFVLLGFCSDEGVKRNQGIPGAFFGPQVFREAFYNLPAHQKNFELLDGGDVVCKNDDLEGSQKVLASYVDKIFAMGSMPLVIGGGHETSWGHLQGIYAQGLYPDILNFDAHFDLRPLLQSGQGSSGTPFFQAQQYLKSKGEAFHYNCAGIQPLGNSPSLFSFAKKNKVNYLLAKEIRKDPFDINFIEKILQENAKRPIYLTICLDVFEASLAPGVSSRQVLGIHPDYVLESLKPLKASGLVVALDIVELNPKRDQEHITAKLAASLLAEFLS